MRSDEERIELVQKLLALHARVLLSHDIHTKHRMRSFGGLCPLFLSLYPPFIVCRHVVFIWTDLCRPWLRLYSRMHRSSSAYAGGFTGADPYDVVRVAS